MPSLPATTRPAWHKLKGCSDPRSCPSVTSAHTQRFFPSLHPHTQRVVQTSATQAQISVSPIPAKPWILTCHQNGPFSFLGKFSLKGNSVLFLIHVTQCSSSQMFEKHGPAQGQGQGLVVLLLLGCSWFSASVKKRTQTLSASQFGPQRSSLQPFFVIFFSLSSYSRHVAEYAS